MAAVVTDERAALLEREDHLAALERALAAVTRGLHGGLAFVAGEAGVGKTELLRRFCAQARGARVRAPCGSRTTSRRKRGPSCSSGSPASAT